MKAGCVHRFGTTHGELTAVGSLAKDQTEINRIIAEASKGSKFYEVCPARGGKAGD